MRTIIIIIIIVVVVIECEHVDGKIILNWI
jgi:hypothetical protein